MGVLLLFGVHYWEQGEVHTMTQQGPHGHRMREHCRERA